MKRVIITTIFGSTIGIATAQLRPPPDVPEIEIKGVKLGMSKKAVEAIVGAPGKKGYTPFTIGGVGTYNFDQPSFGYTDGKFSNLMFLFKSEKFDDLKAAVSTKYPSLRCTQSEIQNRLGIKFQQVQCSLADKNGMLSLTKYSSQLDIGYLNFDSFEVIDRMLQKANKKVGDI